MKAVPDSLQLAEDPSLLTLLGRGQGKTHKEEIQFLKLKVGDVIRGTEGGNTPGRAWWHEVRLTVLYIGEQAVVYRKQWRSSHYTEGWQDEGETANFTLSCREYYLENNNMHHDKTTKDEDTSVPAEGTTRDTNNYRPMYAILAYRAVVVCAAACVLVLGTWWQAILLMFLGYLGSGTFNYEKKHKG